MSKEFITVCAYCDTDKQHTKILNGLGFMVSHSICPECLAVQKEILEKYDEILNCNK